MVFIDYLALNNLLPPVTKVHSKVKGVMTLMSLPNIDEIYARLNGSHICFTFDMKSAYHHVASPKESQPKSAFVTSMGKCEFTCVLLGLGKGLAYFQRLMNDMLTGLKIAHMSGWYTNLQFRH